MGEIGLNVAEDSSSEVLISLVVIASSTSRRGDWGLKSLFRRTGQGRDLYFLMMISPWRDVSSSARKDSLALGITTTNETARCETRKVWRYI